jgi:hypothetical protein
MPWDRRNYCVHTFYTDEPYEFPELNFDKYAERLCKIVTRETDWQRNSTGLANVYGGAFTIGIFGSWGSGKTSLMREIERRLKAQGEQLRESGSNSKYKTVWFNPWKYDGREDVRNALIQTILRAIADDEDVKREPTKRKEWAQLAKRFGLCATGISIQLASAAIQSAINIDTREISERIEEEARNYFPDDDVFDPYLFINQFEEGFKKAVETFVGEQGKIIIFIDDLDRCLPESALTVLESIKLYLDQSNCIFFIGLDKRVVEQAVRQKYQFSTSIITGREYIEKIIRLNFFLPEKSPSSVEKILQVGLTGSYAQNPDMWKLIHIATGSNLRKVKQFVIAFDLIGNIAEDLELGKEHLPHLAKLLLIQLNYPDFFDALMANNSLLRKFENIFEEEEEFFKIKKRMLEDIDGKLFADNDGLMNFLIENRGYPNSFSDKDEITKALQMLSQAGASNV